MKLKARLSTVQGLLRKASDEAQTWKQLAERAPAPPAPAPAPAPTPAPAPESNPEEDALIAELETNAPTVAKAVKAILKRERNQIDTTVEERVKKAIETVTGRLAPIEASAEVTETERHFAAIEKVHQGWEQLVQSPEMTAWAQKQPSFYQKELARIASQGTAAEVIEVLTAFKGSSDYKAPATAPAPQQQPAGQGGPDAETLALRAQQKKALGTTQSRTTPVATSGGGVNKDDFSGGFEKAAATT